MKDMKFKKGIDQIKKISLTNAEKSKMTHNLSLYVDFHMPTRSPFSVLSFLNTMPSKRYSSALASVIIAILISGSVVYASENSLPGDLLYPIKTKIVEPVKIALASTPSARAMVETQLAHNRLNEAEALDKVGKLTPELKKDLGQKANLNILKYNELKKEIEKENSTSSKDKVDKIQQEFDDKINEHTDILNKFNDDISSVKRIGENEIDNDIKMKKGEEYTEKTNSQGGDKIYEKED